MTRKVILLDVDGVLCNFVKPAIKFFNDKTGLSKTDDDVYDFDIFKSLGDKTMWEPFKNELASNELFCFGLEAYDHAKETVYGLKQLGDLHVVTTPYKTKFWHNERIEWLHKIGVDYDSISFVKKKHHYDGDILIDDCFANVQEWSQFRKKNSILVARPWNKLEWEDWIAHERNGIVITKPEEIVNSAEKVLFER